MKSIRLNKFIADSGITSRRKADDLIEEGYVQVNGKTQRTLGTRVDPLKDQVKVRGKVVKPSQNKIYLIFNKPKNVVTTLSDPEGRPHVGEYFKKYKQRLFPVGRLDWDSEGLLLITNDGEFANEVAHPKKKIEKTYLVKLDGQLENQHMEKLRRGVSIMGGKAKALHIEKMRKGSGQYSWAKIVIDEGRNRQVRKMFEKIGFDVKKLQRVSIGHLHLGRLKRGDHKPLTLAQLQKIFKD